MVKKAVWVLFCLAVLVAAYKALPDDLNLTMDSLKDKSTSISETVKNESDKRLNPDNLPEPPKILPQTGSETAQPAPASS